ncbi:ragulator complex protein LAMTOR5 [Halyomorpha halys]|uniref:ragulator complex protein LAMTOR5 n=1 Tax=Halyomorpha halys TaxID=286706 RepID=UPI000D0C7C8A|nr:uncharacterized protein LOC112211177 [Halyomorpha halys]XP_024218143.1 uncharacterized protein LOC112211177 [Halyomorpha halys]
MESRLEFEFSEIQRQENVTGCVLADPKGLCLLASPNINNEVAGLVTAIAQHAALIEPSENSQPIVLLENDTRQCLIHSDEGITTAIFKKIQNN